MSPVAPQMAPPAPAPTPSQPGFSHMLSEAQAPARPAQAEQGDAASRADRADRAENADAAGKAESQARAEERTPEKAEASPRTDGRDEKTEEMPDDVPADPTLADWLATLHRPNTPEALPKGGGHGDLAQGRAATAARDARAAGAGAARSTADLQAETARKGAEPAQGFQAALEQAQADSHATPLQEAAPAQPLHAGPQPTQGAARTGEAAPPAAVQMATRADAPEFARSLGVQVSVLARDGVQQAELHLNPAEMGPISVRIALEGTQAQVNFGADSAATRQIIENGLPELAAALRDAGFTLSGGGVHGEAARGREPEGDAGRSATGDDGRSAGEQDATPERRMQARVSAGGVDVYA